MPDALLVPAALGRPRTARDTSAQAARHPESEHAHDGPHGPGITAGELFARACRPNSQTFTPRELRRWLTTSGLAVEHDGRLVVTALPLELGGGLDVLEP